MTLFILLLQKVNLKMAVATMRFDLVKYYLMYSLLYIIHIYLYYRSYLTVLQI